MWLLPDVSSGGGTEGQVPRSDVGWGTLPTYPMMHVMYLHPSPHTHKHACENITFPETSFACGKNVSKAIRSQ